ncbi:hypothetical protein M0R45_010309 [Rubus argutus]|uniref:Uncharacterized protein n=1 Tax=Rubus argutus TaxID=59490 RepID=A0AAW1YA13_RUBAR
MVSLRRRKCLRLSPCNGSSNVLASTDNETDTDAKPDSVRPMPSNDEDGPEELNSPEGAKTVSVLNNAKRKMRKIDDLMESTETEIIESPKKYQVDLKKLEHQWKKVLQKKEKALKVSEGTKDKLEKIVKKLRTNSDHYLEELNLLQKKNEDESKLMAELMKTCQRELKEAEDNNHAFSWGYCLLDKSHVQSLENIWLEAQDQNIIEEGYDTLENEEARNKIDILDDRLNKVKEERRLQKAEWDAAMVEREKLRRDVELSRVAVELAKAEAAAIKAEKDKIEMQNEEAKNIIDILEAMVKKLKEGKLQKGKVEDAEVESEKLRRDVELSRIAVDIAKAETAAIKAEKDKIEEQNEEVKNKIDILEAMVRKLKEEERLQKAKVEDGKVESAKLRRDVELSRVAVDIAKAETAAIKAEKDKVEEKNEIEMRKKKNYIAALILEMKWYYSCRTG